jgi:glucose-1-phosphate cytidylyltransferase
MKHEGFWCCMDTYKDKQTLDDLVNSGNTPWQIWKQRPASDRTIDLPSMSLVMQGQPLS